MNDFLGSMGLSRKSACSAPTCSIATKTLPDSHQRREHYRRHYWTRHGSAIRNEKTGEESTELAIYGYDKKSGVFSAKGDSGALVVDGLGRMVGLLTGGTSKPLTETLDVSYATSLWWLLPRIKAKYPHADLIRKTF